MAACLDPSSILGVSTLNNLNKLIISELRFYCITTCTIYVLLDSFNLKFYKINVKIKLFFRLHFVHFLHCKILTFWNNLIIWIHWRLLLLNIIIHSTSNTYIIIVDLIRHKKPLHFCKGCVLNYLVNFVLLLWVVTTKNKTRPLTRYYLNW